MERKRIEEILLEYKDRLMEANLSLHFTDDEIPSYYIKHPVHNKPIYRIHDDSVYNRLGIRIFAIDIQFYLRDPDAIYVTLEYKGLIDFLEDVIDLYK